MRQAEEIPQRTMPERVKPQTGGGQRQGNEVDPLDEFKQCKKQCPSLAEEGYSDKWCQELL